MSLSVPIYLSLAYFDEPDKLLIDREPLGERILEKGDYVEVKILLNRDNTLHLDFSYD